MMLKIVDSKNSRLTSYSLYDLLNGKNFKRINRRDRNRSAESGRTLNNENLNNYIANKWLNYLSHGQLP